MSILDILKQVIGGGDPEAGGLAAASQATFPPRLRTGGALGEAGQLAGWSYPDYALQHLQDVVSGRVAARGALGQNNYDPNQSFAWNALNPAAIEQATDIGTGIGPGAIRAFHGSPHSFDRFDLSKIGTGEGNQSYGRGLYFAESEPVAKTYRDTVGIKAATGTGPAVTWLSKAGGDPQKAIDMFNDFTRDLPQTATQQEIRLALETATKPGHMYEVDIHADPQQFLNLDQTLGAQAPPVQRALQELGVPFSMMPVNAGEALMRAERSPIRAADLFNRGGDPVQMSAADVAARLRDVGVPGARYLDEQSRGFGQGTRNYSVFDDKLIDIRRKYGFVPPLAAGGLLGIGEEE